MSRPRDWMWEKTARFIDESVIGTVKEKPEEKRRRVLKHEFCQLMEDAGR